MTFNISYDKSKINYNGVVTVEVKADEMVYGYECRAVPTGELGHKGLGINVLMDEGGYNQNGEVTLQIPSRFVYFNVSGRELGIEGQYDIYVFLKDAQGEWWPQSEAAGGAEPIIDSGDEDE